MRCCSDSAAGGTVTSPAAFAAPLQVQMLTHSTLPGVCYAAQPGLWWEAVDADMPPGFVWHQLQLQPRGGGIPVRKLSFACYCVVPQRLCGGSSWSRIRSVKCLVCASHYNRVGGTRRQKLLSDYASSRSIGRLREACEPAYAVLVPAEHHPVLQQYKAPIQCEAEVCD